MFNMTVSDNKKNNNVNLSCDEEINNKINNAITTLERNITFVTNCDNKTSIVLTSVGVLLTIILTNEGLNSIFNIIKTCISQKTFCNILYLVCFAVSIGILMFGFYNLCGVLIARTENSNNTKSKIFFSGIIENGNNNVYREKFIAMTQEEYLDEIISEIYINSKIATIKYHKYNTGFKCTIWGFITFIILFLIGIYLY